MNSNPINTDKLSKRERFLSLLDCHIAEFEKESRKHKNLYRRYRYTVFWLAASGSVLAAAAAAAALSFTELQVGIDLVVVAVNAVAVVVSSIEGVRKPGEIWIIERNIFHGLKNLKQDFDLNTIGDNDVGGYFGKMLEIISAGGGKWTQLVAPPTHDTSTKSLAQTEIPAGPS